MQKEECLGLIKNANIKDKSILELVHNLGFNVVNTMFNNNTCGVIILKNKSESNDDTNCSIISVEKSQPKRFKEFTISYLISYYLLYGNEEMFSKVLKKDSELDSDAISLAQEILGSDVDRLIHLYGYKIKEKDNYKSK